MCSTLIKLPVITGRDTTSEIGTKSVALKYNPEQFLTFFGEGNIINLQFEDAKGYLVNLIQKKHELLEF